MKLFSVLFLFIICVNLNAQKEKFVLSNWHKEGFAEGNSSSDKYSYYKKGKFSYIISNDKNNIYLNIKIDDSGVQTRILKQGLTVWICMDNKHSKITGIRFPIGSQYSVDRKKPNIAVGKLNPDGSLITPLSFAKTIELIGFKGETPRFPSENFDNFRGYVKYSKEGIMYYEMTMPLTKIPLRNAKDGVGEMPFTFGIEYGSNPTINVYHDNSSSDQYSGAQSGSSRGGSSRGGRSGGGGGSQGGRSQGGNFQGYRSNEPQSTSPPVLMWIRNIKLATEK